MTIVQLTAAHAQYVCDHMSDAEKKDREAVFGKPYETSWFLPLVLDKMKTGAAYACLLEDGTPAVIGGISVKDEIGSPWMCATDDIFSVVVELTRTCRKAVRALRECGKLQTMQVVSPAFREEAHRWYSLLGLKKTREIAGPTEEILFLFEG